MLKTTQPQLGGFFWQISINLAIAKFAAPAGATLREDPHTFCPWRKWNVYKVRFRFYFLCFLLKNFANSKLFYLFCMNFHKRINTTPKYNKLFINLQIRDY